MSVSVVQAVAGTNNFGGSAATQTFAGNVTAGNTIVALIQWAVTGAAQTLTSVTDDIGNTYTIVAVESLAGPSYTGNLATAIAYCVNANGGTTPTVTAHFSGGTSVDYVNILELTPSLFDQSVHANGVGSAISAGSITTLANGCVGIAGAIIDDGSGGGGGWTKGAGWDTLLQNTGGGSAEEGCEYVAQAAAGALAGALAQTHTGTWAASYATFKPAGAVPPVNTVAPAVTGTPVVGQTLSCTTGTWTGDVSSGYAYQWQRDNAGGGVYSNVVGATASTRVLAAADDGCHVRCVVTATGTGGSAAANSNATATVTFAIPTGGSVAVTGSPVVGRVLTATTSGWSPAPSSYAITWQRADDAAFTSNVVTVRGPTTQPGPSDPYTVQATDDGKYLRARATATDDGGTSAVATSAATAQVTTGPPVNVVPPSISGTPIVGGLLTVTPGQWT